MFFLFQKKGCDTAVIHLKKETYSIHDVVYVYFHFTVVVHFLNIVTVVILINNSLCPQLTSAVKMTKRTECDCCLCIMLNLTVKQCS